MMKYSESLPSTSLHSFEDFQNSSASTEDSQPLESTPQDAKISLTSLWEYVVRSNSLPENLDLDVFFALVNQRLRNPEWEVRQHALRVLVDFIPLIDKVDLDTKLQTILNDIVANLGHVGPAVRKGAVDVLKAYINASSKSDEILHELIETGIAGAHDNKIASNVTLGIIVAVPFLITPKVTQEILRYVTDILLSKLSQAQHQESVLRALIRIKGIVGVDRFENILKLHKSRREFEMLSDLYNIPEPNSSDLIGDTYSASDNKQFWSDYNQNIVSSGSFENCTNSEKGNENGCSTKNSEEVVEDKIILETEIKLDSGSAITMKIHEESRKNVANESVDSDEESGKIRTFKVLADDSEDDYEVLRRTPRRVRFGGEIVKMRTPDSDSNHPSDEDPTIIITPNQTKPSIEIRYANTGAKPRLSKSHIPVPVSCKNKATQSEPNSPKRNTNSSIRYMYRSSPNLSRNHEIFGQRVNQRSRIPRFHEGDKKEVKCERSIRIQVNERKTFKNQPMDEKVRKQMKPVRQQAQERLPTIQKTVSQRNENAQEKLPTIQKSLTQRTDNAHERYLNIKRSRSPQAVKANLNEELPVPNSQGTRKLLSPSMYSMQKGAEDQNVGTQQTTFKEQKSVSNMPALEFHPQKSQQKLSTKEVEMMHNLEAKDKVKKNKEFKTQLVPSADRRNSREYDQYSPIPIHNEIEVLHNLTRSPERKQLVNHRDDEAVEFEDGRHLTTADNILFASETLPKITSGRKIHTADVVKSETARNGTTNQLVFINNYNSFHVYNSPATNRYVQELNDSPIPTMDNGECLTCSSSGSDVVVLDGNKPDNIGSLDANILKDIQCKDDIRIKQRGLEELLKVIHDPSIMKSVEERFSFLLHILFSAEQHRLLQSTAEQILTYVFSNAREQTLLSRLQQIGISLSKIGSPVGVRLGLIILKRIPPRCLVDHLLSDSILGAKSSKVREGALQILMSVSRIFPSTEMNIPRCVQPVLRALKDRKRKVRQAALETLAALTQLSSTSIVLDVVSRIIEDYHDREQILRVIRTRLSRKQLPAVDINGNVRYSTPCGESEVEWISRGSGSPPSGRESRFRESEENVSEENIMVDSSYEQHSAGQRVNYWKENLRHRVVENSDERCAEEMDSNFSRDSKDDTSNKINNTQIWAIDPTVFTTSEKLTSINGTLRPLFVIQTNEKRPRNNVKSHHSSRTKVNKETNTGINYNTHQRGRSFSPPKRSVNTFEENDRFLQESDGLRRYPRFFKDEHFQKSFSSDQLISSDSKTRQQTSSSSGSSTSTSGSSLRNGVWNKDVRSGIPIPISSDGRLKFRTRNADAIKGPVISSPLYVFSTITLLNMICNSEFVMSKTNNLWGLREDCKDNYWKMFQCCVCKSRSRKIADSALQANGTPVVEVAIIPYENDTSKPSPNETIEKFSSPPRPIMARQPFSSGSESSGYFTPPAEPHLPTHDLAAEEIRQSSGQPERFIKIDTPMHHQENFTIIDSSYSENVKRSSPVSSTKSEHIDDSFVDFRDLTEDNFDSKSSVIENFNSDNYANESYVKEEDNETGLRRDVSLTSLDELDFIADKAFGEKRNLSRSEANIQISPDLPRKTINSAPTLNEMNFTDFEKLDETPLSSSKTSLPGSVVDFHEIEVVQEIIKKSPTKTICKKTVTRQMSRKRSCRLTKSETGIFSEPLQPFTKTKEAFQETLSQMESGEWEMNMKGLEGMVRLIRYHKDVVEQHMHTVCVALAKHVRNLRSQVARAACLTTSELFKTCKKTIEMDLEELASALLHRTADTNKFLRSDANAALDDMCTHISTPRVVTLLTTRGCGHQNAIVRCAAARLLCAITHRLGSEKFFLLPKDTRDRVLLSGANMLMEGSLETRKHAKMMFGLLSNHSQFHRALMDAVPPTIMRHIEKSLKSLT